MCFRYKQGDDLLDICGSVDFPPCLMIRRMLEYILKLSKQRVSDILKNPGLLHNATYIAAEEADVQLLARLQADIVRCVRADRSYSPFSDMARTLAGLEHEAALYEALSTANIAHWSEEQLREQGLFKTPDAWLQVPIAVRGYDGQWHVVHWIDSKASFGDDRTHSQQLEGQYRTYLNRYGPGMVIYWFGFIAELADDGEVLIMDKFPDAKDIMQLQPAIAT
eukprot:jgi/Chrzof1/11459/Cz05g37120.t1